MGDREREEGCCSQTVWEQEVNGEGEGAWGEELQPESLGKGGV